MPLKTNLRLLKFSYSSPRKDSIVISIVLNRDVYEICVLKCTYALEAHYNAHKAFLPWLVYHAIRYKVNSSSMYLIIFLGAWKAARSHHCQSVNTNTVHLYRYHQLCTHWSLINIWTFLPSSWCCMYSCVLRHSTIVFSLILMYSV